MLDPTSKKAKAEPWADPSLDSERESDAAQERRAARDEERAEPDKDAPNDRSSG